MNVDTDSLAWRDLPVFLPETEQILCKLRALSAQELQRLWKCNDKIAALNAERLEYMDLRRQLTPAILAYEGIQYQYMAPSVFTNEEFDYVQEHLRILSGFYGILKPFDGVTPYRLEMQTKLAVCNEKDLYSYWNKRIAENIFGETNCIINLASKEYSQSISKYLTDDIRFITCTFGQLVDGKIIEKGTMCKMARGEMVRFMAEEKTNDPELLKHFSRLNYRYSEQYSTPSNYVFLLDQ